MNTNIELHDTLDYFARSMWSEFWPELIMPELVITLVRRNRVLGYFNKARLTNADGSRQANEIAINPQYVLLRAPVDTVSTLAHELVHHWQQHFGSPGRGGYHNQQWADEMKRVGLQPFNAQGGETGDSMDHRVISNGPFSLWYQRALVDHRFGKALLGDPVDTANITPPEGSDEPEGSGEGKTATKKRDKSKVRFTCPVCGQNAWAKESAVLACGNCTDIEDNEIGVIMMGQAE